MAKRLYREYINVDPNFIPVFSSNSDRIYPDKWQSFYPHDSFKKILTSVVEMLEKGTSEKDLSQWIVGSYGTGKTYASFTIKHILEDPIENIEPYFTQNGMLALFQRIKGIRSKGKILVVHKSSSAGINSQNKLFGAITASVRESLKNGGYKYMGAKSRFDKVLETLKDPDSSFNFAGAFHKYKARFTQYSTANEVVEDLETLPEEDSLELLDTIIQIAEEENYNWSSTPDEVIEWLDDVRTGNNIYAIVMMWDEFTEFFKNNRNNITGLQEIAHASSRISFYFFLITHSDVNQLISDKDARKILQARFVNNNLKLGENTALALLGQSLRYSTDLEQEWDSVNNELYGNVKRTCIDYIKKYDLNIKDDDLKNLLPMHPYASYLLKFIAQDISSNQRTMFQFMCGEYNDNGTDKKNFRWFIDNFRFDYGEWNLLTSDYLWDYFFYADNVDLDSSFMDAIGHYNTYANVCGDDHDGENRRKVLKVALLLDALNTKNGGSSRSSATSLLRAVDKNIKACFVGTPLENRVTEILDFLENKGILGVVNANNEKTYIMTSVAIDKDRLEKIKSETENTFPFEKIVEDSNYDIAKNFMPTGYMTLRCNVKLITAVNAKKVARSYEMADNQIAVFYLFAKNEDEQAMTSDVIRYIHSEIPERCIVVDFTSLPFTTDRYNRFITNKAQEKYFEGNPAYENQIRLASNGAKDIINEWKRSLSTMQIRVYRNKDLDMDSEVVSVGKNLITALKEMNQKSFYGLGLEEISVNDKLFANAGYKEIVGKIAMEKETFPSNYAYLNNIIVPLKKDGIWTDPEYWKNQPNHVVSQMKLSVEEVIQKGFNEKSMVSVEDIWNVLKAPKIGLMQCAGSVFIMAFLLKEYADTTYYKQDINNNTVSLNYTDLCELIYCVIKGLPKAKGQFIVKQKPEHEEFCKTTGEIFKISKDKRNSISDISKNLNIYLTNNVYPLWSLTSYVDEEMEDHPLHDELIKLINLLCEFVNPEQNGKRDKTKIAEDIYEIYSINNGIDAVLSSIVTSECLQQGMEYYIANTKSELSMLASKLKIDSNEYLSLLTKKLSSDSSYLWQKGDINHQIDNLYIDFSLVNAINSVLSEPKKWYKDAREELIKKLNCIKIPNESIKKYHGNLTPIMQQFYSIKENNLSNKEDASNAIHNLSFDFLSFFNNQYETFARVIRETDNTVTEDELSYLYNNVESGTLFASVDEFTLNMQRKLNNFRKDQKKEILISAWKNRTHVESPAKWSEIHDMPILCMFTSDITLAQQVFDMLNGTISLPSDESVERGIEFVNSPKLDILKDDVACNDAFISYFCDDYSFVIKDSNVLRDTLRQHVGTDVYGWYANKEQCKSALRNMATNQYKTQYSAKAKEKIRSLTAEQAQHYLEGLIDNDPLLGIRILKDK